MRIGFFLALVELGSKSWYHIVFLTDQNSQTCLNIYIYSIIIKIYNDII